MSYYKKLDEEQPLFCIQTTEILSHNLESKIGKLLRRISLLLRRKKKIDLQRGVSSEETVSVENKIISPDESPLENQNIQNNYEERDTVSIDPIEVNNSNIQNQSEETISIDDNFQEDHDENNIQKNENSEDEYDEIENIVSVSEVSKEQMYYVIFKDGGYGWLRENQISEVLIKNWKNKNK